MAFLLLFQSNERLFEGAEPSDAVAANELPALDALDRSGPIEDAEEFALEAPFVRAVLTGEQDAAEALGCEVSGLVMRLDDDAPLADVRVRIVTDEGVHLARTDEDGRFVQAYEGSVVVKHVTVLPTEMTGSTRVSDGRRAFPGRPLHFKLRVGSGATVRGRVIDSTGEPVPWADVLVWSGFRGTSNSHEPEMVFPAAYDGSFEARHVGPEFEMLARAPRSAVLADAVCVRGLTGKLAHGDVLEDQVLELDVGRTMRGVVVDEEGVPVFDAKVRATDRWIQGDYAFVPWRDDVRTAADGWFSLKVTVPDPFEVFVEAEGFLRHVAPAGVADGDLRLVLERGACLSGVVRDLEGDAVVGATVRASTEAGGSMETSTAHSDTEGRFEFCGLFPVEACILEVHATGFAVQVRRDVPIRDGVPNEVEVILEPGQALAGVVLDADGAPVDGAFLTLESDRVVAFETVHFYPTPTWEHRMGLDEATTDASGRFRFEDLHDGLFELRVRPPWERERALRFETPAGVEDLEVVLDEARMAGVTLTGRITDEHTGEPIERFDIILMEEQQGGGWLGRHRSFQDGSYRIESLRPGKKKVVVECPGYGRLELPEELFDAGEYERDLGLAGLRGAVLEVVDELGRPWPQGSRVRVYDEGSEEPRSIEVGVGSWMPFVSLDAEGRVRLPNLSARRFRVEVSAYGKEGVTGASLDLRFAPPDEPEFLRLVLSIP